MFRSAVAERRCPFRTTETVDARSSVIHKVVGLTLFAQTCPVVGELDDEAAGVDGSSYVSPVCSWIELVFTQQRRGQSWFESSRPAFRRTPGSVVRFESPPQQCSSADTDVERMLRTRRFTSYDEVGSVRRPTHAAAVFPNDLLLRMKSVVEELPSSEPVVGHALFDGDR